METHKIVNNRYQLLTVIKRGGFGTIYKGHDTVLGKDIAVKEINRELLQDAWYVNQFQNEARHVAKMNHQNIVHIFDLVEAEDRQFYIIMEFIDGYDLNTLIKESKATSRDIPTHIAVHIIAEICKALDYAHNCRHAENNEPLNLVHQDISPANIMIARNGLVKLIDFGIAGAQKKAIAQTTDTVTLQGKVQYMSPEHVSVEQNVDRRSDIFSLGLVLYELLEGKRFFLYDDTHKIVDMLRNGKLKLKDLAKTPKPLQSVLNKALEKSLDKRYQNANQLYIDLVTYLVLNSDSANIDKELVNFVSGFDTKPQPEPAEANEALFNIAESDLIFGSVLDDIEQNKMTAGHNETRSEVPAGTAAKAAPNEPAVATESQPAENNANVIKAISSKPAEYFEAGDEIKTIIDVVRLSTRGDKKLFIKSGLSVLAILFLFFLLDIAFQWTRVGTSIYDYFFPAAIKVTSIPPGAKAFINDTAVPGTTPVSIDKINPGVYELKLTLERYKPIIKSIHVPSKGQAQIKGEQVRKGNKPYTFRFKTTLEIESVPAGAEVYINDIKYGQNTPCSLTWEVGERCEIKLKQPGFAELSGFLLDTETMQEEIDDRRLWQFRIINEPTVRYNVRGLFGKFITINSNPANAAIFLDDNPNPIGTTNTNTPIFLTAQKHKIFLKKKGYNTRTLALAIDEKTRSNIYSTLTRPVSFLAYDATNGKNKDLGAKLQKLASGKETFATGSVTPFQLDLLPQDYYAIFSKEGYLDAKVTITPDDNEIKVSMEPASGSFSIVILDDQTGMALSNVEVRIKPLDNPKAKIELIDVSDVDGTVNGYTKPGLYLLRTSKNGYEYQEQTIVIKPADINLIELNLAKK